MSKGQQWDDYDDLNAQLAYIRDETETAMEIASRISSAACQGGEIEPQKEANAIMAALQAIQTKVGAIKAILEWRES